NHDDAGIVWPMPLAPFHVAVVPVNWSDDRLRGVAEQLYAELTDRGIETILDDRDERPGVKFKDADLVGIPLRITLGAKGLAKGCVEARRRREGTVEEIPLAEAAERIHPAVKEPLRG
ncbi:MAG: His/Gly/Thr/Pro-type tRNA ligase C-terminal domain-containing protein, partial [Opitutaceae bacterium]